MGAKSSQKGQMARILLAPRTVRIVVREGSVRVKTDAEDLPSIDLVLDQGESVVGFEYWVPLDESLRAGKTVKYAWRAFIKQDPPPPKPRKKRSTGNRAKKGTKT